MVEFEYLKSTLDSDEKRLEPSIDLLVKFGFIEFNDTNGRITLASSIKTLLDELQSEAKESDV